MCLYIDEAYCNYNWMGQPKASVALDDFQCYKVLMQHEDTGLLMSPYREEKYQVGELKKVWMRTGAFLGLGGVTVHNGLHAVRVWRRAELLAYSSNTRYSRSRGFLPRIYSAVIPKGAKYYIGHNDDIVSNRLLLGEMLKYDEGDDDA